MGGGSIQWKLTNSNQIPPPLQVYNYLIRQWHSRCKRCVRTCRSRCCWWRCRDVTPEHRIQRTYRHQINLIALWNAALKSREIVNARMCSYTYKYYIKAILFAHKILEGGGGGGGWCTPPPLSLAGSIV